MSFSQHTSNRANNVYVLGHQFIQGINETTIYAESDKRFLLSLHYNGDSSYLFINGVEQLKFKSKVNYLEKNLFRLVFTKHGKKTGVHGNIYDCSIDYWPIDTGKTRDIRRYLMKNNLIV